MSIYLVGAPFWRVKIHWLLLGCNHERASLADYSDAGCMERGAGWKQRENEGKQGGWTSRAQLGGFLYHTEGRLVGREQNSLNHTFDSQKFVIDLQEEGIPLVMDYPYMPSWGCEVNEQGSTGTRHSGVKVRERAQLWETLKCEVWPKNHPGTAGVESREFQE